MGNQLVVGRINGRDSNRVRQPKQGNRDVSATAGVWCGARGMILRGSRLPTLTTTQLRRAFDVASNVAFLPSNNQHFDTPQAVSSIYTGREDFLEDLRSMLFVPAARMNHAKDGDIQGLSNAQKRFVVYGLGGSGKTQFCCKFAQDNRERLVTDLRHLKLVLTSVTN